MYPSELLQRSLISEIPLPVGAKLGLPEIELRFRHPPHFGADAKSNRG